MKKRLIRTIAAVTLAAAAATMTACSSSEDSSSPTSAATTTQAGEAFEGNTEGEAKETGVAPAPTTPPNLPKPTVEELNSKISKAFDPAISSKEKTSWIEDAEQDPELADKLVEAAKTNKVQVEIVGVQEPADGKLKADAKVTIDGKPVDNASVDFVAEEGEWKVANQFACSIVKTAKLNSAACAPS